MAEVMPPLRLIAGPRTPYRPRYMREGRPHRNRAQRLVRAEINPHQYVYPAIEIPQEWISKLQQPFYIRVMHITVLNEAVDVICIHPYPIDTEDINVIKDPATNSLYFLVSNDELQSGRKSFQFTLYKLTQYQLNNYLNTYGSLRILNTGLNDNRLEDITDTKRVIDTYQLSQSRLIFSIAIFQNNLHQNPLIYDISSVYSRIMIASATTANDDDISFRCSPQRGDWRGNEEIIMVIPKVDRRRAFTVRFDHPSMDPRATLHLEFVDSKTISFYSPPCPVLLTKENPSFTIPIVVTQNNVELVRLDFVYQAIDVCLTCKNNKRPLSYTDFEETDEINFDDLIPNKIEKKEVVDLSHKRNFITTTTATQISTIDGIENVIQQGNIDSVIELLERKNEQGETPLLIAAKYNRNQLITIILKKRSEYAQQIDNQKNNLLHLLANIPDNQANDTIENIFMLLDDKMIEFLILGLNQQNQTPEEIAKNSNNLEYIDLFTRKINSMNYNK